MYSFTLLRLVLDMKTEVSYRRLRLVLSVSHVSRRSVYMPLVLCFSLARVRSSVCSLSVNLSYLICMYDVLHSPVLCSRDHIRVSSYCNSLLGLLYRLFRTSLAPCSRDHTDCLSTFSRLRHSSFGEALGLISAVLSFTYSATCVTHYASMSFPQVYLSEAML